MITVTHLSAASRFERALYCVATALSVAAVVYHQSMIHVIAQDLQVPAATLWSLSVATQAGYGIGLVMGLPLGDMIAPRQLIPAVVLALGAVLLLLAGAPNLPVMVALCFVAGVLSIGGQLLIAHNAKATPAAQRATVIGALLSALFAGLLLARVLAGWGADLVGWRFFYAAVGVLTAIVGFALRAHVGQAFSPLRLGYRAVLKSQVRVWRQTRELRCVALVAASFFAALNGIWANLASLLHETLQWDAAHIGLLAFTAVAGLRAPSVAALMLRYTSWTMTVTLLGVVLAVVSFAGFRLGPTTPMLIVFLAMADLCVRAVHVVCQNRALAIDPTSASRMNSLFMTVFFLGAALGSWLGGIAVYHFGWAGMYLLPVACCATGVVLMRLEQPQAARSTGSPHRP